MNFYWVIINHKVYIYFNNYNFIAVIIVGTKIACIYIW